jgi:hypothetical protein
MKTKVLKTLARLPSNGPGNGSQSVSTGGRTSPQNVSLVFTRTWEKRPKNCRSSIAAGRRSNS